MPDVLALDVGGTKLAAGLVRLPADGDVSGPAEPVVQGLVVEPTEAARGGDDVAARAGALVARVAEHARATGARPVAAGVAAAGVVEPGTGRIAAATDLLPGWAGVALAQQIGAAAALPTRVLNDVHAHALGLAGHADAGRVLCVALGTGLGGAWVQDGRPVLGARGAAGHLGHIPVPEAAGMPCSCGRRGHAEAVASGSGLEALHASRTGRRWSARQVAEAAAAGDAAAAAALETAGRAAGVMIGAALNLLDPDEVLLAGGLSAAGAGWERALHAGLADTAMDVVAHVPVRRVDPGPTAALVGAARWALTAATGGPDRPEEEHPA